GRREALLRLVFVLLQEVRLSAILRLMWYPNPAAAAAYRDRQTRTLYLCIGVSMALHALAMISLPASRPASRSDEARALTALFDSLSEPAPAPRRPREHRRSEIAVPVQKVPEPAPSAAPEAAPAPTPPTAQSDAVASAPAQVPAAAPARLDTAEIV